MKTMLSIKEASQITGLSYGYLRQLCLQNKLCCLRAGVKWYINANKLIEYLDSGGTE